MLNVAPDETDQLVPSEASVDPRRQGIIDALLSESGWEIPMTHDQAAQTADQMLRRRSNALFPSERGTDMVDAPGNSMPGNDKPTDEMKPTAADTDVAERLYELLAAQIETVRAKETELTARVDQLNQANRQAEAIITALRGEVASLQEQIVTPAVVAELLRKKLGI